MVKRLFTFILGLTLACGASAQLTTIDPNDVQFWVGSGSNSTVVAIGWDDDDASYTPTVVIWGVRWNGNIYLLDALDSIAAYDSRFTYTFGGGMLNTVDYNDPVAGIHLSPSAMWNCNSYGGAYGSTLLSTTHLRISESTCSNYNFTGISNIIYAEDPNAPEDALIDFADILYWVGSGTDSAALIVNFGIPDTAFAWGYLFNGTATVQQMTDAITAADPRFTVVGQPSLYPQGDIFFVLSNGDTLSLSGRDADNPYNYWEANINGDVSYTGAGQVLVNGDVFKYGDQRAPSRVCVEEMDYGGVVYCMRAAWTKAPTPVSEPDTTPDIPVPDDATIAASDILFWVGHGSNEVVMAVNWADTALAWGYRFNTETVTAQQMMDDIAATDPRFSYVGSGYINDINYIDTAAGMTDTLGIAPGNWWWSLLNHVGGWGLSDVLHDGDFYKWGDLSMAVVADSTDMGTYMDYAYVWPYTIHPVSVPDTTGDTPGPVNPEHGPFCGAVGTEGCTAIAADSSAFVAWATGVSVTRGPQNITNPDGPLASTGEENNAVGMATLNDVYDVVSLGDGGSALVTFAHPIRNGDGPDFAVFENGFSDNSLELAFVEVSTDGERFVRFPATCLTQTETQLGNAGQTDPTNLNNLAGKYRIGYGTPFDLEELRDSTGINIDSIVYVRVVDVVGCIDPQYGTYDAFGHIINDPWPTPFASSGFDLTGVGVIHECLPQGGIDDVVTVVRSLWPNPTTDYVHVSVSRAVEAVLYDLSGRRMAAYSLHEGNNILNLSALRNGVYMLRIEGSVSKIVKR